MKIKIISKKMYSAIAAAALVSLLFFGCKEDDSKEGSCYDGIKNQDETGIDCGGVCYEECELIQKMTAKINGASWTADTAKLIGSYTSGSQMLNITGRTVSTIYPTITLVYVGSLTTGTYPLHSNTRYTKDISSFINFNSGTISLNIIDSHKKIINGSFNFSCIDTSAGITYNITEGVLENIKYTIN